MLGNPFPGDIDERRRETERERESPCVFLNGRNGEWADPSETFQTYDPSHLLHVLYYFLSTQRWYKVKALAGLYVAVLQG